MDRNGCPAVKMLFIPSCLFCVSLFANIFLVTPVDHRLTPREDNTHQDSKKNTQTHAQTDISVSHLELDPRKTTGERHKISKRKRESTAKSDCGQLILSAVFVVTENFLRRPVRNTASNKNMEPILSCCCPTSPFPNWSFFALFKLGKTKEGNRNLRLTKR